MSRTTFFPNAKTITTDDPFTNGNPPVENTPNSQRSSYESRGADGWRRITDPMVESNPNDILPELGPGMLSGTELNGFFSAFGDNLTPIIENGPFGSGQPTIATPFTVRIGHINENEYTQYFREVETPPTASEVINLVSSDPEELDASISEARSYYNNLLQLNRDRKRDAETGLSSGRLDEHQTAIARQFVARLDEATRLIERHLADLDEYAAQGGTTGGI